MGCLVFPAYDLRCSLSHDYNKIPGVREAYLTPSSGAQSEVQVSAHYGQSLWAGGIPDVGTCRGSGWVLGRMPVLSGKLP